MPTRCAPFAWKKHRMHYLSGEANADTITCPTKSTLLFLRLHDDPQRYWRLHTLKTVLNCAGRLARLALHLYFSTAGFYNPETGISTVLGCLPCPAGKYCDRAGLAEPTKDCDEGFYCVTGARYSQEHIESTDMQVIAISPICFG